MTKNEMRLASKEAKLDNLLLAINGSLYKVVDAVTNQDLSEARAELAEASNTIDDAMHLIDDLMQPEEDDSE